MDRATTRRANLALLIEEVVGVMADCLGAALTMVQRMKLQVEALVVL